MSPQDIKELKKTAQRMAELIGKVGESLSTRIKESNGEGLDFDLNEVSGKMDAKVAEANREMQELNTKISRINGNIY